MRHTKQANTFRSGDIATIAISSGVLTLTSAYTIVQAQTGTADDLATINVSITDVANTDKFLVILEADSGDTITLKHGTGNITLLSGADLALGSGERILLFGNQTDGFTDIETSGGAGGGSAAPTDAEYLTTALNGTLSAEVVIPGLAGSPDIEGAAGGGVEREFDNSGGAAATWSTAPLNEDFDTTAKSHWYIEFDNTTATEKIGTFSWSPAGAFDARMKITGIGYDAQNMTAVSAGLHIGDSDNSDRLLVTVLGGASGIQAATYTAATYTQRGSTEPAQDTETIWLRITRDGSNNCSFYFSRNGLVWELIATQSFTLTVANIGLRLFSSSATNAHILVDWLRTDV